MLRVTALSYYQSYRTLKNYACNVGHFGLAISAYNLSRFNVLSRSGKGLAVAGTLFGLSSIVIKNRM
jgi:hypothetical protein